MLRLKWNVNFYFARLQHNLGQEAMESSYGSFFFVPLGPSGTLTSVIGLSKEESSGKILSSLLIIFVGTLVFYTEPWGCELYWVWMYCIFRLSNIIHRKFSAFVSNIRVKRVLWCMCHLVWVVLLMMRRLFCIGLSSFFCMTSFVYSAFISTLYYDHVHYANFRRLEFSVVTFGFLQL